MSKKIPHSEKLSRSMSHSEQSSSRSVQEENADEDLRTRPAHFAFRSMPHILSRDEPESSPMTGSEPPSLTDIVRPQVNY